MNQLDTMPTGPGTSFEKDSGITLAFLAIVFPWLYFFVRRKFVPGLACLVLQCMLVGWLPASVWAMKHLINARWEKKKQLLIDAVESSRRWNLYTC